MNTLNDFRNASPKQRPDMICDGLSYVQSMVNNTTQHLRILNTWSENMPGLISEGASHLIPRETYLVQSEELHKAIDSMGEQITRLIELQQLLQKNCLTNP